MTLARLFALALLPLAAATNACAAASGPPSPSPSVAAAAKAPDTLGYFVGSWRAAATDPATGQEEVLSYRVERAVDGWLAGAGASEDLSFQARDMWGRDAETGGLIRVVFSGGGGFATFRSPGWKGDTLVFEGAVASKGSPLPLRQTITRIGPDEFRAVWEARRDGAWRAYSIERLTRQPT